MEHRTIGRYYEGFNIGRLLMVLSSISPLFVLWAINGTSVVPDRFFLPFCAAITILPTGYLCWRIRRSVTKRDKREIVVGRLEDYKYHALTYIFAMLIPFYRQDISSPRELISVGVALVFIILLFWKLRLHYINLVFLIGGFQIFLVHPYEDENPYSGRDSSILITRRHSIEPCQRIMTYRVTDTVYVEWN